MSVDLVTEAPSLFTSKCVKAIVIAQQPRLLRFDEVKAWRAQTFKAADGHKYYRQAMPFPPLPDPLAVAPNDPRVMYGSAPQTISFLIPALYVILTPIKSYIPGYPYVTIEISCPIPDHCITKR